MRAIKNIGTGLAMLAALAGSANAELGGSLEHLDRTGNDADKTRLVLTSDVIPGTDITTFVNFTEDAYAGAMWFDTGVKDGFGVRTYASIDSEGPEKVGMGPYFKGRALGANVTLYAASPKLQTDGDLDDTPVVGALLSGNIYGLNATAFLEKNLENGELFSNLMLTKDLSDKVFMGAHFKTSRQEVFPGYTVGVRF